MVGIASGVEHGGVPLKEPPAHALISLYFLTSVLESVLLKYSDRPLIIW